ncbi:MAG TPA: DUF4123 domain-containing protein [Candidatus Sulfopaludibacter sp.]|jgi:hypothetical protein|nr:DUF4123 domain-containing protein [Candidatus Sulfopaludibacter sp.]
MTPDHYQRILNTIWPASMSARTLVCAIVDSARDDRIYGAVDFTRMQKECLYAGDLPWQLQMTAPYLVELTRDDRLTKMLLQTGWGESWCSYVRTQTGFKQLRRHLRQFLRVRSEDGQRLVFRYYDPRVLRVYLPTCRPGELETFFGPIESFITEGEDPEEILEFQRDKMAPHIAATSTPPV